jgi:hypothetical protein
VSIWLALNLKKSHVTRGLDLVREVPPRSHLGPEAPRPGLAEPQPPLPAPDTRGAGAPTTPGST